MATPTRTKVLAGIFAAVIGGGFGGPKLRDAVMAPIDEARAEESTVRSTLEAKEEQKFALIRSQATLAEQKLASLPYDANTAQRLYREWIDNLARQSGFTQLAVSAGARSEQPNKYISVSVEVEAEATLEQLSRFMSLFRRTRLMHRISDLNLASTATTGDPRFEVTLTAEGISVYGAELRSELFSRTPLVSEIDAETKTLKVTNTEDFSGDTPFLVRIEDELLQVTEVNDTEWTVERGASGTIASAHIEQVIVEHWPAHWDLRTFDMNAYSDLLASSPFVKPSPPRTWKPSVSGIASRTIKPGETVTMTVKTDDFNPDLGEPTFSLKEPMEGLTLDAASGELSWVFEESAEAGSYSATVITKQTNNPDLELSQTLTVEVKIPNESPSLTLPEQRVAVLGRPWEAVVTADDDGPSEDLQFSLADGAPSGMEIDPNSGVLTWTPQLTMQPGEYSVTVKVTDGAGEPASDSETLSLDVRDDHAIMTFLVGCEQTDRGPIAWFRNRATGEDFRVLSGQKIEAAEISARVEQIEAREVTLRDEDGLWTLRLGKQLRDRKLLEASEPQPTLTSAEVTDQNTAEASSEETAADEVAEDGEPEEEADSATTTSAPAGESPAADKTAQTDAE